MNCWIARSILTNVRRLQRCSVTEEAAPDAAQAPDDKTVAMDVGEVLAFPQAEPVQEKEEVHQAAEAAQEDAHEGDVHEAEPQTDNMQPDQAEATRHEVCFGRFGYSRSFAGQSRCTRLQALMRLEHHDDVSNAADLN